MATHARRFRLVTAAAIKRLLVVAAVLAAGLWWCSCTMIAMPGKTFSGPLPEITPEQGELAQELKRDIEMLAGTIGPRSIVYPEGLDAAAALIEKSLANAGYDVVRQTYKVGGINCSNLIAEIKGGSRGNEILVVGAHYDSVDDSPAANDNGSGVAATLALARRAAGRPFDRTVRFVLFVNEEPPFFQTADMGSLVYAKACQARGDDIVAMISLETIGYYSDRKGSQIYPIKPIGWLYPDTGNFIGFVGNYSSRDLVRRAIKSFRGHAQFPSQGAALPGWITGVGWSDHWSFWQCGYRAIMVTDTAPFSLPPLPLGAGHAREARL